jgi:hypothetical protein
MEVVVADLRHYLGIWVDEQRKNTKHVNQGSRLPIRDLIMGPPKYEPRLIDCDHRSHEVLRSKVSMHLSVPYQSRFNETDISK